MGSEKTISVRSRIVRTTNSMGGGADYEDRPPVEPYVPAIEVKNRCQPDFSECVGKSAKEAERIIQEKRPELWIEVIPHGTVGKPGPRYTRVRLYLDQFGNVSERPIIC